MRPGRSSSTSWPRRRRYDASRSTDAIRPHPQQPTRAARRVGGVERDGADGQHRAGGSSAARSRLVADLRPTVDEAGAVDAHRRVQPGDRTRRLQRPAQRRPWGAVGGDRFSSMTRRPVSRSDATAHTRRSGHVLGVELRRPVVRSRRATASRRGSAVGARRAAPGSGHPNRAQGPREYPGRPDGSPAQLRPRPPRPGRLERAVGIVVTRRRLSGRCRPGRRSRRAGRRVAGRRRPWNRPRCRSSPRPSADVEAGVLQRHQDAGTDPDRHGAAAADDHGEAIFRRGVPGHRSAPCAAATSSSIAPARQSS